MLIHFAFILGETFKKPYEVISTQWRQKFVISYSELPQDLPILYFITH